MQIFTRRKEISRVKQLIINYYAKYTKCKKQELTIKQRKINEKGKRGVLRKDITSTGRKAKNMREEEQIQIV